MSGPYTETGGYFMPAPPAGAAACLACGWRRYGLAAPWRAAQEHSWEAGHPTVSGPNLPDGTETEPPDAGLGEVPNLGR